MQAIANSLHISLAEFKQRYTRQIEGRTSLQEDNTTYDCVFLKGKQCTIYDNRPKQCRTFPWWPENLESCESWKEAASRCEGINHPEAPVIAFGEIQQQLAIHLDE